MKSESAAGRRWPVAGRAGSRRAERRALSIISARDSTYTQKDSSTCHLTRIRDTQITF